MGPQRFFRVFAYFCNIMLLNLFFLCFVPTPILGSENGEEYWFRTGASRHPIHDLGFYNISPTGTSWIDKAWWVNRAFYYPLTSYRLEIQIPAALLYTGTFCLLMAMIYLVFLFCLVISRSFNKGNQEIPVENYRAIAPSLSSYSSSYGIGDDNQAIGEPRKLADNRSLTSNSSYIYEYQTVNELVEQSA